MIYKLWSDAENQINSYVPIEVHWSEIPGRDEEWKKQTIANTSAEQFSREFECVSGDTNIIVMNKQSKEIKTIKIEELF